MKRSFPPPAREVLAALVGALACGAACTPNHDVKPGAPELVELIIGQTAPPSVAAPPVTSVTVRPDTPDCVSGIVSGLACLPQGQMVDADGGMDHPADGLCRDANNMTWCTCVPGMDPKVGAWDCSDIGDVFAVIAVFDRVLDTAPFDAVEAGPIMDSIVTTSANSGAPVVSLLTDYSPTGASIGLVFNVYGPFFGNLRGDGPSLLSAPQPEFPSAATVTITLDASQVRAKDGTTPFTGTGPLSSGTLVFKTAQFSATITPPDMFTPIPIAPIVAFSNFVDPADAAAAITATADGTALPVDLTTFNNSHFMVTPKGSDHWPSGATVTVSVAPTITNLLGQAIAPVTPFTFTAPVVP
jgi:hypothetical protein